MFLKKYINKYKNLLLYGVIGCCASGLDFAIYSLLILSINYILANCISVLGGITTSFLLNRKYNFKVKDRTFKRFVTFLSIGLCGMLISNLILYICIDIFDIHKLVSKLLSIVLVVIVQYLLNKNITFKQ